MYAEFGTYTGTGVAISIIVGFRIDAVYVFYQNFGGLTVGSRFMPTSGYLSLGAGTAGYGVDVLTAPVYIENGFTVPSGLSVVGHIYHWMALQHENDVGSISWSGDGSDGRNLTGLAFQPDYVFIAGNSGAQVPRLWHVNRGGDSAGPYEANWASNKIQGVTSNGFQVGSDMNAIGVNYSSICFKANSLSCAVSSYIGDGIIGGHRVIAIGTSWDPAFVTTMQRSTVTDTSTRGPTRFITNTADQGMQVKSFGEFHDQTIIAFGGATFTIDITGGVYNQLDYEFYYLCIPRRLGGVLSTPAKIPQVQSSNKGSSLYPSLGTGTPGSYEFHKTVRKAMRQFNNLTLGD